MSKPILAIVGRPNVGKSTFFNRIIGERRAIVEDVPGVTRDRIYAEAEWNGKEFAVIDTGGIEVRTDDTILAQMRDQAVMAMDMADVIVFMVDGKEGLTTADREVATMLRRTGKEIILVVNKVDKPSKSYEAIYDFYELGFGEPIAISAANMTNMGDLLDRIVNGFPQEDYLGRDESINIAVIGKPNVGKSSLVNALTKQKRVIVSPIAGTTRDTIDTPFTFPFLLTVAIFLLLEVHVSFLLEALSGRTVAISLTFLPTAMFLEMPERVILSANSLSETSLIST